MAKCQGRCERQDFQTRNFKFDKAIPDPNNPEDCPKKVGNGIIKRIGKDLKAELEESCDLLVCKGGDNFKCDCSFGPAPKWGNWVKGVTRKSVTIGKCKYTLQYTYEIRSRILTGACVTVDFTGEALGSDDENSFFITTGFEDAIDPEVLLKVDKVLSVTKSRKQS